MKTLVFIGFLFLVVLDISAQNAPEFSYQGIRGCIDSFEAGSINLKEYLVLKDTLENLASSSPNALVRRKQAVIRALNSLSYLQCIRDTHEFTIVVNIPSATLLLFKGDTIVLESRVIVGRTANRTPTISSMVTDVTLYPYWFVPKSIVVKELLPLIRKDPQYLERNGFQVLNLSGKIVDPAAIDWYSLGREYFPYTIRQSTGCDNSLGIIKFNFYNPFNVYLHDTPWKSLFNKSRRFYSHGCVRVEKAIQMAHVLLKDNGIAVDTLAETTNSTNRKPVLVKLPQAVPVFILYNTAWIDSSATPRFYPDIYNKLIEPK